MAVLFHLSGIMGVIKGYGAFYMNWANPTNLRHENLPLQQVFTLLKTGINFNSSLPGDFSDSQLTATELSQPG